MPTGTLHAQLGLAHGVHCGLGWGDVQTGSVGPVVPVVWGGGQQAGCARGADVNRAELRLGR